jgi:hypothetical protein
MRQFLTIFASMPKIRFILLFCLFVAPILVFGQPCGGLNQPPCDPGEPVPIPGLAVIFLSGLVLGIFKLVKKKNQ